MGLSRFSKRALALAAVVALGTVPTAPANAVVSTISTFVGTGSSTWSGDGTPAHAFNINAPYGMTFDSAGNLYFADAGNHRIRKVTPTGTMTTVAGNGSPDFLGDGGQATSASLNAPQDVAVASNGDLYISDWMNNRVRKVTAATGVITTIAGNGGTGSTLDNVSATTTTLEPYGLSVASNGDVYVADYFRYRVRKIGAASGLITTAAGTGSSANGADGVQATASALGGPHDVTLDSSGNMFIADAGSNKVRKVTASTGIVTTIAGSGTSGFAGDGASATAAQLAYPTHIALDPQGDVYIADFYNRRIRKVSAGNISTVAGNGTAASTGDGGEATAAALNNPFGVALSPAGDLYASEIDGHKIRKVMLPQLRALSVTGTINPSLTFTVGATGATCNTVAQTAGTTALSSALNFGDLDPATPAAVTQNLTVNTNAGAGYTITARSTGPFTRGAGSIADITGDAGTGFGTNASPRLWPASTEAFGYTTNETGLSGTGDRFTNGGPKFARFTTTGAEVARATAPSSRTTCVALKVGITDATPHGAYSTTVIYTAIANL